MKVIDFATKGNLIKIFCGADNCDDYWGDDWNDVPYEHNAEEVYDEFVKDVFIFAVPFEYDVLTPASDWHYGGNSPFSKEDMKNRKCPCIIIAPESYFNDYSTLMGADNDKIIKIYFGDDIETLRTKAVALQDIGY